MKKSQYAAVEGGDKVERFVHALAFTMIIGMCGAVAVTGVYSVIQLVI